MLRFRIKTEEEARSEHGSDYRSVMSWHEADMDYLFGYELSDEDVTLFDNAIASDRGNFKLASCDWWIKTKDIVLARDIYIKSKEWFIQEFNNTEFWEEYGCIATEDMVQYCGRKIDESNLRMFMVQYIDSIESSASSFGWSWKLNWFTSINPNDTTVVKVVTPSRKSCISMNELSIHRGVIQITIMQAPKESSDDVVYFVDGDNGETYEIPKRLVLPRDDDAWYQLKAINTKNGADATHILRLLLERDLIDHLDLDCFQFTPLTIKCNDLDILMGAVYNIKGLRQEYEKAVYENSFKEKYPLLSYDDIQFICNEQRKIQGLVEVFETEA